MWEYAGVVCSIWAYDAGDVEDIEGVAVVCRTKFTSFKASSDHRSTLRTYMVCSISLLSEQGAPGQPRSRQAPSHQWGGRQTTHLQSISLPVFASLTMSLTQGGGVMGRRSYLRVSGHGWLVESPKAISPKTSVPCRQTHTCAHVVAVAQHQGCRRSG